MEVRALVDVGGEGGASRLLYVELDKRAAEKLCYLLKCPADLLVRLGEGDGLGGAEPEEPPPSQGVRGAPLEHLLESVLKLPDDCFKTPEVQQAFLDTCSAVTLAKPCPVDLLSCQLAGLEVTPNAGGALLYHYCCADCDAPFTGWHTTLDEAETIRGLLRGTHICKRSSGHVGTHKNNYDCPHKVETKAAAPPAPALVELLAPNQTFIVTEELALCPSTTARGIQLIAERAGRDVKLGDLRAVPLPFTAEAAARLVAAATTGSAAVLTAAFGAALRQHFASDGASDSDGGAGPTSPRGSTGSDQSFEEL